MGKRNSQACILALPSLTYAMRANELLSAHSIQARVISLDGHITKKGCSNGLELDCRMKASAKELLISRSIPVSDMTGG